jgi:hypothetical protein
MRNRLPLGITLVLMTILVAGVRTAPAWESENLLNLTVAGSVTEVTAQGPGRLAALSARQQLRDEVCIAMADGRISRLERFLILADGKRILKPEEYAGFRESLERLSPPAPVLTKQPVKIAQKKPAPAMKHKPPVAKVSPAPRPMAKVSPAPRPTAKVSTTLTIPSEVLLPDRVVLTSAIR